MNEVKDKVIVISAFDSGEKDKKILFYGLNLGLNYASLKGVKQPKAKLKFLAQTFSFAEVVFFENKTSLIVKTADSYDTFFEITKNYEKFEAGGLVLEVLKGTNELSEPNSKMFLETIKVIKEITYNEEIMPIIYAIKFACYVLENSGLGCVLDYDIKSKLAKEILKDIIESEDISFIKPNLNEVKEVLKILKLIYEKRLNIRLKSI